MSNLFTAQRTIVGALRLQQGVAGACTIAGQDAIRRAPLRLLLLGAEVDPSVCVAKRLWQYVLPLRLPAGIELTLGTGVTPSSSADAAAADVAGSQGVGAAGPAAGA